MSKVLVVHIDHLLVESTDSILSQDRHTPGIEFVHRIYDNWLGSSLFVAEYGPPDVIRNWLAQAGFKPTWVDVYEYANPVERMERIMSGMGDRQASVDLFVTSQVYDAQVMSSEGVSSCLFLKPTKVKNWGPEPGSAWHKRLAEMGLNDEGE